jgi:hypothetical protein
VAARLSLPEAGEHRGAGWIPILICLAFLTATCYADALFRGGQFAFRDAAHFYYPLYERVQQEWGEGHLPLWEPGENGGTPLLGSPMAAVLYPGKLLFALVPYAWGIRLYVVAHELLAFAAMLVMARSWGISRTGAALAGLAYAFGGPVLSNHYNVIYLVGAAWAPLGFRAADAWLRLGRRSAPGELALVLALQVLGGDPEAACVTCLCAFGYAMYLAPRGKTSPQPPWRWGLGLLAGLAVWLWIGPAVASWIHGAGPRSGQSLLLATWGLALILLVARRPPGDRLSLAIRLSGLTVAGALALALAGIQVLPVLQHIAASVRWTATGVIDLYEASLLPYRMAEFVWPNLFGSFTHGNHYWITLLPPAGAHRPAPLSLYLGILTLLLALAGAGFRNGPAWRGWMTIVAIVTLTASLGQFAGLSAWSSSTANAGGDDSFYGLLATILPCLRLFRLPYKLLVFTSLAMAVLSGAGWDRLTRGEPSRRHVAFAGLLLALSVVALALVMSQKERITSAMAARPEAVSEVFGPLDAPAALAELLQGLMHGAVAMAASVVLLFWGARHPGRAGIVALVLLTADLALANARLVVTIPQADFERMPEVVRAIRQAEEAAPEPGPFRVHRLASWVPTGWSQQSSAERLRELVDWEIDTLQPRFGLLHGISYLLNDESRTEERDYWSLFQPSFQRIPPSSAASIGLEPGRRVLWHPRQAFDLWGTRYFILPSFPGDWFSPNRSYAAFLDQTELIYPDPTSLEGPEHQADRKRWMQTRDVQVRRNKAAFPRAWVIHQAHAIEPLDQLAETTREALLQRLRSGNDPARAPLGLEATDFRQIAYVETNDPKALTAYLPGTTADPDESVAVQVEGSTRVTLEARLKQPGLVVLADTFNDGWYLTIDGQPASVLRANLLMRAAPVTAGTHTLVYTYHPRSVQLGALVTAAGLALWIVLQVGAWMYPGHSFTSEGRTSAAEEA